MEGTPEPDRMSKTFLENLPPTMTVGNSYPEQLLLREYGAVFVARGGVVPPDRIVFADSDEVERFQRQVEVSGESIGGFYLELQTAAMDALREAIAEAGAA